ncbi:hypothetical protein POJ06DRAFT_244403 [Lipomyces tetrasporus]|uniref:N-acetyltransferase domain-containing protein n=1 Tax=Lipomyces tetrasporus TaxID=54092 RepID=A0AAD7VWN4_9ASCO|nr:uncharacterized protein POJ06DRAFT_244403 [Lipomyces tetrasporus]KAJ8104396.1 hypothetical protein POJ06DRAFT_244403 [Lipomyces tetrasporus]
MEKRSETRKVVLIPWDPNSSEHRERLYEQRIACGWKADMVEKWQGLQRNGKMAIQWVVLSDEDPERDSKLALHTLQFPVEKESILDSATTFGGLPRMLPNSPRSFIPVGHISLDSENPDPSLADPSQGLYCITTFYISRALQGTGLGRAAMDAVEGRAMQEPLCAKTLALDTIAREFCLDKEAWKALGIPLPTVNNQDWYERRGYKIYKRVEHNYPQKDLAGKIWHIPAVFMKKSVV